MRMTSLLLKLWLLRHLSLGHHLPGQCAPGESPEEIQRKLDIMADMRIRASLLSAPIPPKPAFVETTTTSFTDAVRKATGSSGQGLRAAIENLADGTGVLPADRLGQRQRVLPPPADGQQHSPRPQGRRDQ